jgi:hypothetical protein
MACKRKYSKYSSIISSNYIFKGFAFETLGPWCHRKSTYCGIRRFKIKENPFRENFPCHSTWKRCKHSANFSRFHIIIGNFCIVKQKLLLLRNCMPMYVSAIYRSACTAPRIFETQDEGQRQCMGLEYRKREQGKQCELRRLRR